MSWRVVTSRQRQLSSKCLQIPEFNYEHPHLTSTILPKSLIVIWLRHREDWENVKNYHLEFKTGSETVMVTEFADTSYIAYYVVSFPHSAVLVLMPVELHDMRHVTSTIL